MFVKDQRTQAWAYLSEQQIPAPIFDLVGGYVMGLE